MQEDAPALPSGGRAFEDTIDGYFPLHVSLRQMLHRNGFTAALVTLSHAPMLHVPGLPEDAPVPLNIRAGDAGIIKTARVWVSEDQLIGFGTWRWLTPQSTMQQHLDPAVRLAEPVFVDGTGWTKQSPSLKALSPHVAKKDLRSGIATEARAIREGWAWGRSSDGSLRGII